MLGFGELTLGAYWAHYAMHRTRTLNNHLPAGQRISILATVALGSTAFGPFSSMLSYINYKVNQLRESQLD